MAALRTRKNQERNQEFLNQIHPKLLLIYPPEEFTLDYMFNCDEVKCMVYKLNDPTYPAPLPVTRLVFKNDKYITPYLYFSK